MRSTKLLPWLLVCAALSAPGCGARVLGGLDDASADGDVQTADRGDASGDAIQLDALDTGLEINVPDVVVDPDVINTDVIDVPGLDVPLPDVPTVDVPLPDVPIVDVPGMDVPIIDVPIVDVPIVDVPIVDVVRPDTGIVDTGVVDAGVLCPMPSRACYTGGAGTQGVGECRAGVSTCVAGVFGPCVGEVTPVTETCNNRDDNCNGQTDEQAANVTCGFGRCQVTVRNCVNGMPNACVPNMAAATTETCNGMDDDCDGSTDEDGCNCVYVSPTGLDTNPGTGANPMRTINAAIAAAATGGRTQVCVAQGTVCAVATPANYDEAVVMRNGISVLGGFMQMGTTWPRNLTTCATRIRAQTAEGVVFPDTVVAATALDGFIVENNRTDPTTAGITVRGTGAVVSNDTVTGGAGTTAYGVNIVLTGAGASGAPSVIGSSVTGGTGRTAVGVHVSGGPARITSNCPAGALMNGTCTLNTGCSSTGNGIRSRGPLTGLAGGFEGYGILLENARGTVISTSAVCGRDTVTAAGVRLNGTADNISINTSSVSGDAQTNTGDQAAGVWADGCTGAPVITANAVVSARQGGGSTSRADGVRSIGGACATVIDGNTLIQGGLEVGNATNSGVHCAPDSTGRGNPCVIANNTAIRGVVAGIPTLGMGIDCERGSCARIENNTAITGNTGVTVMGIRLGTLANPLIDRNNIAGGCGRINVGIDSTGSGAQVTNNIVLGALCPNGGVLSEATGVRNTIVPTTGGSATDLVLHSNTIDAGTAGLACTSTGAEWLGQPGGIFPGAGVLRNNIILAGTCATQTPFVETGISADPRIFENNDLITTLGSFNPTLYRDEGATNLSMIAQVNALTDMVTSNNISAAPMLTGTYRIMAGTSPCVDTGTATGAPARDIDNELRPKRNRFDIGADEF